MAKTKLTAKEQSAVDSFLSAARALPRSICIETATFGDAPQLIVSKRREDGCAIQVAQLTKASLLFT